MLQKINIHHHDTKNAQDIEHIRPLRPIIHTHFPHSLTGCPQQSLSYPQCRPVAALTGVEQATTFDGEAILRENKCSRAGKARVH